MAKIKKIVDEAYDYLLSKITSKEWPEGTRLPSEYQIAEELGISRVTVRTAIKKLCALGLLESRPGNGTFVIGFDMSNYFEELIQLDIVKDMKDILLFRNFMEIGSIRMSFSLEDFDDKIAHLRSLYAQMEEALRENDLDAFASIDRKFHTYIVSMSGNKFILMVYKSLYKTLMDTMDMAAWNMYDPKNISVLLDPHSMIIDAMENRDIEGCFQAKFVHIDVATKTGKESISPVRR